MSEILINPGEREWFSASDWTSGSYLFEDDRSVWFSMMIAAHPGTGALSRLMEAVWGQGRRVVVPGPFPHMEAILRAKGFAQEDGHPCDVWVKDPATHTEDHSDG